MASELVDIRQLVDSKSSDLEGLLSGSGLTLDRFKATVFQLWDQKRELRQCTSDSILSAILAVADVGLTFTPNLGHAYLVKYGTTATPMIGYRGLIHLALQSGGAQDIRAGVRRKLDTFQFRPVHPSEPIVHEPAEQDSPIIGYYCIAFLHGGLARAEYMTKEAVQRHRDKFSKAKSDGPWVTNFDEMAMKTVVRRVCKYLRLTGRFDKAMGVAEMFPTEEVEVVSVAGDLDNPLPEEAPRKVEPEVVGDEAIGDSSQDYRDIMAQKSALKLSMSELCNLAEGEFGVGSPELLRVSQVPNFVRMMQGLRK